MSVNVRIGERNSCSGDILSHAIDPIDLISVLDSVLVAAEKGYLVDQRDVSRSSS